MELLQGLLASIVQGSSPALTALLLVITGVVGWISWSLNTAHQRERKELIKQFQDQLESDRDDLLEVIEKYQEGQLNVIQTINDLKVLIATLGGKL
jgi:uncharacterized protein YbgA (DUF1722 family)